MSFKTASSEFAGVPVVLTAGIFYNDPENIRFETSLDFAERARDLGVPAVFVDSSPEDWVADAHRERGAIVLPAEIGGIATQRQQGVAYAVSHGAEKVVGTESEKPGIPELAPQLSKALDTADILVVGRTPGTEYTLPPVQQRTERLAGWLLENTLGLPADALAGPRGFTIAGAEVLADYPATEPGMNNWIYLYDTILEARERGLKTAGVILDFPYPEGMVAEETGNSAFDGKRLDQFVLQLEYLLPKVKEQHGPLAQDIASQALYGVQALSAGAGEPRGTRFGVFNELEHKLVEQFGYKPAVRFAA